MDPLFSPPLSDFSSSSLLPPTPAEPTLAVSIEPANSIAPMAGVQTSVPMDATDSAMPQQSSGPAIPRSLVDLERLIQSCGVSSYESRVVHSLLEFQHRLVKELVDEATAFRSHAGRNNFELEDFELAVQSRAGKSFPEPPAREAIAALAQQINSKPLPPIDNPVGVVLPPKRFQLTAPLISLDLKQLEANFLEEEIRRAMEDANES